MMAARIVLAGLATLGLAFGEGEKLKVGDAEFTFSPKVDAEAVRKRVEIKSRTARHSPFRRSLSYDSTVLKIFELKGPRKPGDTLSVKERGIFSEQWAVLEKDGGRYLNLSDLGRMGLGKIDLEAIDRWITGGGRIKSQQAFEEFAAELQRSKVLGKALPGGFQASTSGKVDGFDYVAATYLKGGTAVKLHYLISPRHEVMLIRRETVFEVRFPKVIPHPGMPSWLTLENPADSVAYKTSNQFKDITRKYEDKLFN